MKKLLAVLCVFGLCALTTAASDKDDRNKFHANLRGINETPGPVATQATGTFDATLSDDGGSRIEPERETLRRAVEGRGDIRGSPRCASC